MSVECMKKERKEGGCIALETRVIDTIINLLISSSFRIPVHPFQSHRNKKWGGETKKKNTVNITV